MTDDAPTAVEDMPRVLPLFPLSGVLLLPRGHLPLNIFEPRYVNMTEAAIDGDGMIGLAQPMDDHADPVPDGAAVYPTGCAGRITDHRRTDDGRILITLTGVSRYRMVEELSPRAGYRRMRVSYANFPSDREAAPDGTQDGTQDGTVERQRLLTALSDFFHMRGLNPDWDAITDSSDEVLVTSLSMICPFDSREKQALLECDGLAERCGLLTGLMEMAIHGAGGQVDGKAPAAPH